MGISDGRRRDELLVGLFREHYDDLRGLAYVIVGDQGLAEEIVMDVFVKALSIWRGFRGVQVPSVYLRRMVINLSRSRLRRRKLERAFALRAAEESSEWSPEIAEQHADLWAAVRELPWRQRACVVLRYVDDLTEAEIAEIMQCPDGTVKSQLSRARGKLAEQLERSGFQGDFV